MLVVIQIMLRFTCRFNCSLQNPGCADNAKPIFAFVLYIFNSKQGNIPVGSF